MNTYNNLNPNDPLNDPTLRMGEIWKARMLAAQQPQPNVPVAEITVAAPDWETPAHTGIDLRTVSPEDLGLDPYDMGNSLVRAIYRAQEPQPTAKVPTATPYVPNFLAVATKMTGMGAYVVPVPFGTKVIALKEWQNKATRDAAQLERWHQECNSYNCAIVGKLELGALWGFDDDSGMLQEYEDLHGKIPTYRTKTVSGNTQLLFAHNEQSIQMGNLAVKDAKNRELWSARCDNRYVLSAGSVAHPHNDLSQPLTPYSRTSGDDVMPICAPSEFIQFLIRKSAESKASKAKTEPGAQESVHEGGRNNALASYLGKARETLGLDARELYDLGCSWNQKTCVPPLHDDEVRATANSIGGYKVSDRSPVICGGINVSLGQGQVTAPAAAKPGEHRLEFTEDVAVIPEFDPAVVSGVYAKFVELITRGTTLVPQFAYLAAKTYVGLRLAGKVKFKTVDAQPRYFGVVIGETGSGKGAAWARLTEILNSSGAIRGSPGMIKIVDGVDSGAGLKDLFFEDPQDEPVLVYVDEAVSYANKTTATRNPSALDDVLELADKTTITRTLAAGRGKQKSKHKSDAYLAMYMCAQDGDVLQRLFAGRGKLGALDRLTPEYSVPVKPGRMCEIPPRECMQLVSEVTSMVERFRGKTIDIQPEAEALLEAFWESQEPTVQSKVRWKKCILVDAYMSAAGELRDMATVGDMQIAIRLFERQLALRNAFFKEMDVTDKVGYFLAKVKEITNWMVEKQKSGVPEWAYAQSKRDYARKTNAYRKHEERFFETAWQLHSSDFLSPVKVKKASNGQEYMKYVPLPEEPEW